MSKNMDNVMTRDIDMRISHSSPAIPWLKSSTFITDSASKLLKPGILVVTLHEARNLESVPVLEYLTKRGPNSTSVDEIYFQADSLERARSNCRNSCTTDQQSTLGLYKPYAIVEVEMAPVVVNAVEGSFNQLMWAGNKVQIKFDVSRVVEVTIHLYVLPADDDVEEAILLGSCSINPSFQEQLTTNNPTENISHLCNPQQEQREHNGVKWVDLGYNKGQIKVGVEYFESKASKIDIEDFDLLELVGIGTYGKVVQVRKKDTKRVYALKIMRKKFFLKKHEVKHAMSERAVLAQISSPFIVPIKFAFQSPEKLYLVMSFVNGGDLWSLVHQPPYAGLGIKATKFYIAEIVCALEILHNFNVIHRDVKPENILLDHQGHIVLGDFGVCKQIKKGSHRANTRCGTRSYNAPEQFQNSFYTKTVDWWALGVLLFEIFTGRCLFVGTPAVIREKIQQKLPPFPDTIPPETQDLLHKLLDHNPNKRLGARGPQEVKAHAFFHDIDWQITSQRKLSPPIIPEVWDEYDTINFGDEITTQPVRDSVAEDEKPNFLEQAKFEGYEYGQPMPYVTTLL